jgi:hypothetical protein
MKTYACTHAVTTYKTQVAVVPPEVEVLGPVAINAFLQGLQDNELTEIHLDPEGAINLCCGWGVASEAYLQKLASSPDENQRYRVQCQDAQLVYGVIFAAEYQADKDAGEKLDSPVHNDPDSHSAVTQHIHSALRGTEVAA